jgi:hypothetical protein
MDDRLPWRHRAPPLARGTGTSARFWTDLPVTIGTLLVPPGTYRLELQDERFLVLLPETRPRDGSAGFTGRVELAQRPNEPPIYNWSLAVVTTRIADDTLTIAEGQVRHFAVTTIRHAPGTRSVLRLRYLDRELSAPIAAR